MLQTYLIHPQILRALGSSGHGSKVLIADGNFPGATHANPAAERVYLNLRPGQVSVTDILATLVTTIPIEAVQVMQPADGQDPPIFADFHRSLPQSPFQALERFAFYQQALQSDVALVIVSGDQRLYANILLTIGVVVPE